MPKHEKTTSKEKATRMRGNAGTERELGINVIAVEEDDSDSHPHVVVRSLRNYIGKIPWISFG